MSREQATIAAWTATAAQMASAMAARRDQVGDDLESATRPAKSE